MILPIWKKSSGKWCEISAELAGKPSYLGEIMSGDESTCAKRPRNRGGLGASAPPLFATGKNVPFFWNESALFHGIEMPLF